MVLAAIKNRRSVRVFKDTPVPDIQIQELIKAAQFAPTGIDNRSLEFIVVTDPKTKLDLFKVLDQDYVRDAPVLIVPVIDTGKSVVPVEDLSVATQNIFIQATALGLGTVWKNVPRGKANDVRGLLGIPANFLAINLIPVGVPKRPAAPHAEDEFKHDKIHYEKWGGKDPTPVFPPARS